MHILRRAEVGGHGFEGDRHCEDDDGRHHGDKALGHTVHCLLEAHQTAGKHIYDYQHEGDNAAPRQTDKGIGVAECGDKIARAVRTAPSVNAEEPADIHHAQRARDDENAHGEHKVDNAPLGVGIGRALLAFERAELTVELGVHLVQTHRTEVKLHKGYGDDEHKGEQRVEVIRYRHDEKLKAGHADVKVGRNAGHRRRPRGYGRDHAHGRGGRVDEVGELRAGDAMPVRNWAHDRADGQAVEVIVDKNEHAQHERCEHRAHAGLDVLLRPAPERGRAAGGINQRDDYSQQHEEKKDARVVGDRGDEPVIERDIERPHGGKVGAEHRADDNADEQRGVCLLDDECQHYCHERRHKCPESSVHRYLQIKNVMNRADTVHDIQILDRPTALHPVAG